MHCPTLLNAPSSLGCSDVALHDHPTFLRSDLGYHAETAGAPRKHKCTCPNQPLRADWAVLSTMMARPPEAEHGSGCLRVMRPVTWANTASSCQVDHVLALDQEFPVEESTRGRRRSCAAHPASSSLPALPASLHAGNAAVDISQDFRCPASLSGQSVKLAVPAGSRAMV